MDNKEMEQLLRHIAPEISQKIKRGQVEIGLLNLYTWTYEETDKVASIHVHVKEKQLFIEVPATTLKEVAMAGFSTLPSPQINPVKEFEKEGAINRAVEKVNIAWRVLQDLVEDVLTKALLYGKGCTEVSSEDEYKKLREEYIFAKRKLCKFLEISEYIALPGLVAEFTAKWRKDKDIHSETAKKLGTDRETAKALNYLYLYGADDKTLQNKLGREDINRKIMEEICKPYDPAELQERAEREGWDE